MIKNKNMIKIGKIKKILDEYAVQTYIKGIEDSIGILQRRNIDVDIVNLLIRNLDNYKKLTGSKRFDIQET